MDKLALKKAKSKYSDLRTANNALQKESKHKNQDKGIIEYAEKSVIQIIGEIIMQLKC